MNQNLSCTASLDLSSRRRFRPKGVVSLHEFADACNDFTTVRPVDYEPDKKGRLNGQGSFTKHLEQIKKMHGLNTKSIPYVLGEWIRFNQALSLPVTSPPHFPIKSSNNDVIDESEMSERTFPKSDKQTRGTKVVHAETQNSEQ